MYGKDKMLDALNVVVNEMHEYKKQAIELTKQLEEQKKTTSGENKVGLKSVFTYLLFIA